MKFLSAIALLLFLCVQIEAWVAYQPYDPNDPLQKSSSHCYGKSYGLGDMKEGESKRAEKECVQATCNSERGINLVGCISASVSPPCYMDEGDLSKPHPECCPKPVCPKK